MILIKRIFAVIIIMLISINLMGQKKVDFKIDTSAILLNKNLDSFLSEIQVDSFEISFKKKDIPSFVKKQLNHLTHGFSIANPNETYQATDVIRKNLPDRKLLFLGINKDIIIMTYLTGGIATTAHILFIKLQHKRIVDLWTGRSIGDLKSKIDILNYIKNHRSENWGLNTNRIWL